MGSRRIKRIEEVLKEELSKIIYKEADLGSDFLATLTKVEVSPDIKIAKVWVSVFPEKFRKKAIKDFKNQLPCFQRLLIKKMNMKWVPEISFADDTTEEEASKIEKLIKSGIRHQELGKPTKTE